MDVLTSRVLEMSWTMGLIVLADAFHNYPGDIANGGLQLHRIAFKSLVIGAVVNTCFKV